MWVASPNQIQITFMNQVTVTVTATQPQRKNINDMKTFIPVPVPCLSLYCHFPCYQASQQTFSDDWKDSKWFILPSMSPIMLSSICFGPTMNIDPSIVNEWFCTALGSTKPSNSSELATVSEMTLSMLIGGTFRNVQKNKHEKNYGIVTDDSWHTKC